MHCNKCGAENPEGKTFCADCGHQMNQPVHEVSQVVNAKKELMREDTKKGWYVVAAVAIIGIVVVVAVLLLTFQNQTSSDNVDGLMERFNSIGTSLNRISALGAELDNYAIQRGNLAEGLTEANYMSVLSPLLDILENEKETVKGISSELKSIDDDVRELYAMAPSFSGEAKESMQSLAINLRDVHSHLVIGIRYYEQALLKIEQNIDSLSESGTIVANPEPDFAASSDEFSQALSSSNKAADEMYKLSKLLDL